MEAFVTKVSIDTDYKLWCKQQVVVLTSRVHFCVDMNFVGDAMETSKVLADLLQLKSQYSDYICEVLDKLCDEDIASESTTPVTIDQFVHPFRPLDVPLPQDHCGCCYLLLSLVDHKTTYIGETGQFLGRRLSQHNAGFGAKQTSNTALRPWALLSYVTGFSSNASARKSFEKQWERLRDVRIHGRSTSVTPTVISDIALEVIGYRRTQQSYEENLRYVKCGTMSILD